MYSLARSESAFAVHTNNIRQIFLSYYPCRLRSIYKSPGAERWVTRNMRVPVSDNQVLEAIDSENGSFFGLRWGEQTRFLVLDIDKDSRYHNLSSLEKILGDLADLGLAKTVLYRSSMSNGWHLYMPLAEPVPSAKASAAVKRHLKSCGYEIKCGQLEVFPSGAGLRLPLQAGFAWLDDEGRVALEREELTADEAISLFVHDIESNTNHFDYTQLRIIKQRPLDPTNPQTIGDSGHSDRVSTEGFEQLYSNNIIQENYEKGRVFWSEGIRKKEDIHEAILCVGHYLWFGDSNLSIPAYPGTWNDSNRERLIRSWLDKNHAGLSEHINAGDWSFIEENIKRAVEWRGHSRPERESYPMTERARERLIQLSRRTGYVWTMELLQKANEQSESEARQKIRDTVELFLVEGRKLERRAIARESGCSRTTVKRHSDLWLPLSNGSGVYNLGVRGALVGSQEDLEDSSRLSESDEITAVSAEIAVFESSFSEEPLVSESSVLLDSLSGQATGQNGSRSDSPLSNSELDVQPSVVEFSKSSDSISGTKSLENSEDLSSVSLAQGLALRSNSLKFPQEALELDLGSISIYPEGKDLSEDQLAARAETKQLVIDFRIFASRKRGGRGPP